MEQRRTTVPPRYRAVFPRFLPAIGLLSLYLPVALWLGNTWTSSGAVSRGHRNAALWFLAVSGYAFLIALGLGLYRGWDGLGGRRFSMKVCIRRWCRGGPSFLLLGAFCLGWHFVLQRMRRICWMVLSLGGFVLLTLALQLRMLSARPLSEAMGMILISLPVMFVVAMAIWVWGVSPLKPVARHGC